MKHILMALLIVTLFAPILSAKSPKRLVNTCIYQSSFTLTDDTAASITDALFLKRVNISSASAGGYVEIFDRDGSTTSNQIDFIDADTIGEHNYDIVLSSGLTYNTSGLSGGVNFIFRTE